MLGALGQSVEGVELSPAGTRWTVFPNIIEGVFLTPSHFSPGIQLADFVAGATYAAHNVVTAVSPTPISGGGNLPLVSATLALIIPSPAPFFKGDL